MCRVSQLNSVLNKKVFGFFGDAQNNMFCFFHALKWGDFNHPNRLKGRKKVHLFCQLLKWPFLLMFRVLSAFFGNVKKRKFLWGIAFKITLQSDTNLFWWKYIWGADSRYDKIDACHVLSECNNKKKLLYIYTSLSVSHFSPFFWQKRSLWYGDRERKKERNTILTPQCHLHTVMYKI